MTGVRSSRSFLSLPGAALFACACLASPAGPAAAAEATTVAVTNRFEAEIRAMARRDATNPPPADPILFAGSSSIRMWKSLAADFPGRPVLNNGFGGARMSDLLPAFDRVIAPYRPPVLVVYCGENDVAHGRDAIATADDYLELFRRCRALRADMRIAVIPMKPSIKRRALWPALQAGNARIAQHCAAAGVDYIDIVPEMLGTDGQPRRELLIADDLHMSAEGYRIWTRHVTRWLDGKPGREPTAR
jgi:lysophospholipase L1-like esterase